MSTGERQTDAPEGAEAGTETAVAEPKTKLALDVQIEDVGPCKKHVKVAIPRSDVERQFKDSLGEMTKEAHVPGFRPGHAPKGLVEKRFRKEMANQVKSALLMASLEQLDEDYKLNPISQPNLDVAAIELPEDGPMKYEIEVEVRPDFPLPAYKALTVKRAGKTMGEADVDASLKTFLERYAQLVPKLEGGAEVGDFLTADLKFHKDGQPLNEAKEIQLRLQPELRFQDGHIPNLEEALKGVKPGETRETQAQIGSSSPDAKLRGQTIGVTVVVHDLKTLRMPEVNEGFLRGIGFDSLEDLRNGLREMLDRRLEFQKREALRRDVVDQLLDKTPIDLPADLVSRQEALTLRRRFHELRESGLDDSAIRAREAQIRANVHESTLQSLKEFFLLAKIAEAEEIKVEDEDMEAEIMALAMRTDESPRRIRARVEKEGLDDVLASQILERKTIDRISDYVKFEETALTEETSVETIDETVGVASEEPEEESAPTEAEAEGGSSEA
jgi:trigger factor